MPRQHGTEPSVRDQVAARGEPTCDVDGSIWGGGGLVCRIKLLTTIALIAFLLIGSALGLF